MPRRLVIASILMFVLRLSLPLQAADLKPASRMALLRGLVAEYGVLQAPLPRGDKGLRLDVGGDIDRAALLHELTQEGTAIPAKVIVQVTRIEFRDKEIEFEINGGGKKKTKWYEHIEIGMGTRTTPINNPNADTGSGTGSKITLLFPDKLQEMTVDDVKANTGFEVKSAKKVETVQPPTKDELDALRNEVDKTGVLRH